MTRYIDADELKEWVENWPYKGRYYHNGRVSRTIPVTELYDILEQMPTADVVERKRGKWKLKSINTFELAYGSTGYEPVYE